jgi:hypothetical protein
MWQIALRIFFHSELLRVAKWRLLAQSRFSREYHGSSCATSQTHLGACENIRVGIVFPPSFVNSLSS